MSNKINKNLNLHTIILKEGTGIPIFIIPGIGGKCEGYFELANSFTKNIPIYGIEMFGLYDKETPYSSIEDIARKNIKWIKEIQPVGPFFLIGHSFGSHVAFEMTKQLELKGNTVGFLALVDAQAQLVSKVTQGVNPTRLSLRLIGDYLKSFDILEDPLPQWTGYLIEELSGLERKLIPDVLLTAIRNNTHCDENKINLVINLIKLRLYNDFIDYSPSGKLVSKTILFKSTNNEATLSDEDYGWEPYCVDLTSIEMSGNHDMYNNNNSQIVAAYLESFY